MAVEDGGTGMKVISYLYDTSDDSFTVQWVNTALNVDASASLQPGYQMSLSVDGSYLYVTHSTGVVMFDASSGSEEDRYSSTQDYYSLLVDQAGGSTREITEKRRNPKGYKFGFNWPYDYLSFVELIKMDVDVLVKKR